MGDGLWRRGEGGKKGEKEGKMGREGENCSWNVKVNLNIIKNKDKNFILTRDK